MSDRPVEPPDPTRRRFFRQFAGDVLSSVGSVVGAAQVLQQQSAEAARDLLAGDEAGAAGAAGGAGSARATTAGIETDASTAGWRAPFRWDGDTCLVVDQRRLPDVLVDLEVRGAADAVTAIGDGAITGGAVHAQLAAVTLALVAGRARGSRAFARRATIRGAASALRQARPGSAAVAQALGRMLALLDTFDHEASGDAVEAALRMEAEAIIAEASADHGALVTHAMELLPGGVDEPFEVLTAGSTGAMGSGQFGTAVSAIITAHHEGRRIRAVVAETRPGLEGARVATWELAQAGVPCTLVTDAAAAGCIADGEIAAVLVTAERIAANGDVIGVAGTYPLAPHRLRACRCSCSRRRPRSISRRRLERTPLPNRDARVRCCARAGRGLHQRARSSPNPRLDLTPASLVTAIVTEAGVARAPFGPVLAAHVDAADIRRASAPGFAALVATLRRAWRRPHG